MTYKTPRLVQVQPQEHAPDSDLDHSHGATQQQYHERVQTTQEDRKVSRDEWLNTRLLKLLGIVYGIASPFIVWLVVTLYSHTTELELQKLRLTHMSDKMTVIAELNKKIDELVVSINKIQIDIATLKAKANLQ